MEIMHKSGLAHIPKGLGLSPAIRVCLSMNLVPIDEDVRTVSDGQAEQGV